MKKLMGFKSFELNSYMKDKKGRIWKRKVDSNGTKYVLTKITKIELFKKLKKRRNFIKRSLVGESITIPKELQF